MASLRRLTYWCSRATRQRSQGKPSSTDPVTEARTLDEYERDQHDGGEPPPLAPDSSESEAPDDKMLGTAVAQARRASQLADRRERNHEQALAELGRLETELKERGAAKQQKLDLEHEQRSKALDDRCEQLDARERELNERAAAVSEREQEMAAGGKQLQERRAALLVLEQAARSDFADYRHQQLMALEGELERRRTEFDGQLRELSSAEKQAQASARDDLLARQHELTEQLTQLAQRELANQRRERLLAAREQRLEQDVADLLQDERARMTVELDRARHDADTWRQRYEATDTVARQRASELADQEAAELILGTSKPEAAAELQNLRRINAELRQELATRPHATQERLRELEDRCRQLSIDRDNMLRQNEELRRELAAGRISVIDKENAHLINRRLTAVNETLQQEIERHTATLENLRTNAKTKSPFPACDAMDRNKRNAHEPELPKHMPPLDQFITQVRNLIAHRKKLYYTERDLRCFLGGLAASRLHLLEGISGTGKTLLPNVFAEITPQDLLGYYNPFERTFYESEFMQALYRAQLPLHRGKPSSSCSTR